MLALLALFWEITIASHQAAWLFLNGGMMEKAENLKKVLGSFLDREEIVAPLSLVLEYNFSRASCNGVFSYKELENLLREYSKEIIMEMLTWAAHWRLILPSWRKGFRSLCWGDRMAISTRPGTRYEVLMVVQCLVDKAAQTGLWDPEEGIRNIFESITDLDGELALQIVKRIAETVQEDFRELVEGELPYYFIPIYHLKEIFDEAGLTERKDADLWVVELKATDVMSPEVNIVFGKAGEEFGFELNPSLFVKLK